MKAYQNKVERFRNIAKKLVDDHSAELFSSYRLSTDIGSSEIAYDAYNSHLESLGQQLTERAYEFIATAKSNTEIIKSEVLGVCNKYLELFVKRNQPVY
jgi:histone H3/H4